MLFYLSNKYICVKKAVGYIRVKKPNFSITSAVTNTHTQPNKEIAVKK